MTLHQKSSVKCRVLSTLCTFYFALLFGAGFGSLFASNIADRMVATVGDEIILLSELNEGVEFIKVMSQVSEPDSVLPRGVLDELIKNRLILEEAKKESVEVSRVEIDKEVEKNVSSLRQRFENEQQFQDALKKEGITERVLRERYRDDIKKRLISQKLLIKKGLTNINITPTAVKKFYDLHKDSIAHQPSQIALAHILFIIKPSPIQEEAGQKKITEIYDIIMRGGDFEEVAKSFSEDKRTLHRGGYIGNITIDLLQPEIQVVVINMKPDEISQPFRSRNGYEIIKCINKKGITAELSHILVRIELTRPDTLEIKKNAQKIRGILVKGARFDSLVQIYSDDPMTKDSGGYLGEFLVTGLQEPYRSAIEKLPTGAISEPVLSEHGYHLIKVLAREEERTLPLEEMQDQIRNFLLDEQLKEKLQEYLLQIAERTYIEKHTN